MKRFEPRLRVSRSSYPPSRWRSPSPGCLPRRFPDTDTTRLVARSATLEQEMRYPLRSRTPISGMKNLGLYVPPNAVRPRPAPSPPSNPPSDRLVRADSKSPSQLSLVLSPFSSRHLPAAKTVAPLPPSQRAEASKKASIPAPRIVPGDTGAENDAPPRAVAFTLPEPKPAPAPLAAICRNAMTSMTRKDSRAAGSTGASSSRRGSRSRGGRGRSSSVRVVVVPKATAGPR